MTPAQVHRVAQQRAFQRRVIFGDELPLTDGDNLYIRGMWGLGDNIYQRPFVRAAASRYRVFLDTPWPELYSDMDIRFVRGDRPLRTQMRNLNRQPHDRWSSIPSGARMRTLRYGIPAKPIPQYIEASLPLDGQPFVFDLPDFGAARVSSERPIAVIRPATTRREWFNSSRNPSPEYIAQAAEWLMPTHHVVVVADLQDGAETLIGAMPPHHEVFARGELLMTEMLTLCRQADVIVGGVGWIVPASVALRTKLFLILGGMGAANSPERILDPRMDASRVFVAKPDRYCTCSQMVHQCDKRITNFRSHFETYATSIGTIS